MVWVICMWSSGTKEQKGHSEKLNYACHFQHHPLQFSSSSFSVNKWWHARVARQGTQYKCLSSFYFKILVLRKRHAVAEWKQELLSQFAASDVTPVTPFGKRNLGNNQWRQQLLVIAGLPSLNITSQSDARHWPPVLSGWCYFSYEDRNLLQIVTATNCCLKPWNPATLLGFVCLFVFPNMLLISRVNEPFSASRGICLWGYVPPLLLKALRCSGCTINNPFSS